MTNGHSAPDAETKLAFLERILACGTLAEASRRGLRALALELGAGQAAIMLRDVEHSGPMRLDLVATHGVKAPADVTLELTDREHPLLQALTSRRATALPVAALASAGLRFEGKRCTAYALGGSTEAEREAAGLLLVAGAARGPGARWLVSVLGQRLMELREQRGLDASARRLDRERARLESILRAVPEPVLLSDRQGRLSVANARAAPYFTPQQDDGEDRRRAVALNNTLFAAALPRHALAGNELARRELPIVDPSDGSDRLFELVSAAVVTPDGPGLVSVLRNVTDLQLAAQEIDDNYRKIRLAEALARAERDRLDLIIDSVADPIVVTDANGAMLLTNAPAERLFTASTTGSVEELARVRANDAHFSSHVSNLFFVEATGRFRGELGLTDPRSGAHVPVEAISGKIVSEMGEVTAIVTILHDQTEAVEKTRLYEELKQASDLLEQKVRDATAALVRQNELLQRQALELEAASSAKSQFLANMSHEFRTPLNAILGYTSMLLQGVSGPLSPSVTRQLSRVDSNGKHLLTIINDVLDIARIEAGKMPLNLTRFALADLVKEVLAEVDPLVKQTGLTVRTRMARALPTLRSDRPKIKQILMNLISNALKFTPSGSITVAARRGKQKGELLLSVADTGIGISQAHQDAVFQDFRQVDNSPTRQYGGTGLGLAICRRLATHLGGDIKLASKVGEGSTFTIVLPVKGGVAR